MTESHEVGRLTDTVIAEIGQDQGNGQIPSEGGPWHVIWRRPDGKTQDIGKTAGYATQDEAQAIGRQYLHSHGGGFHLRRA